jgi:tetratricopeptide (TPR) repeat protein/TolB-like protein
MRFQEGDDEHRELRKAQRLKRLCGKVFGMWKSKLTESNRARRPLIALVLGITIAALSTSAMARDTLVTVPFENVSGRPEYNWIGESFSVMVSYLLDTPGLSVIRSDERNIAYDRVGVRSSDILTRAAVIKIADSAQANLALVGTYDIGGESKKETIAITARLIETREGRLVGNRVFNFSGSLGDLQSMQGQLAWNVLYERDPSLPYSRDQLIRTARGVPPRAYESLVKGIQTSDLKLREKFLTRAVEEYRAEGASGHYAQAIYELGMLSYRQKAFPEAIKYFKTLTSDDPHYFESLYYLGLADYSVGYISQAAQAFDKLGEVLPLTETLNNAAALQAGSGNYARAFQIFQKAEFADPKDTTLRFNHGYALWKNKNYAEAAQHLRAVVVANPRDGEAQYLLAKSLAGAGQSEEAGKADQEARRYLGDNYARWESGAVQMPLLIRLRMEFNRPSFYKLERQQSTPAAPSAAAISLQQNMLRARQLYEARNDTEALDVVQRILSSYPTAAEAQLIKGRILLRRNDVEGALGALSAASYYNPKLVGAHVALGQIYLSRGDRAKALAHSQQALEIDPQDRDAIALKRQIESGN